MPTPAQPRTLYDSIGSLSGGVNEGISPLELPPNTMSAAVNTTIRGGFVTHRAAYTKKTVEFTDEDTQTAFQGNRFQGGCFYFGDDQLSSLMAMVSGRLFQIQFQTDDTITCREITISGGVTNPNRNQAWLWQSEKYVIVQDGQSNPIFFDGTGTAARSNYGTPTVVTTTTTSDFASGDGIPEVGTFDDIDLTAVTSLVVGNTVTFQNIGTFQVLAIAGLTVTLLNIAAYPVGQTVPIPTTVSYSVSVGTQLPPGRMGAYGMGRNWICLTDGKQFVASDIVGGASGTAANNFRDAPLYITENLFIKGGGNFTVPGSVGDIQAMTFAATLDASLGQGPLQVFTANTVFSCQAPVDRLTWQSINNPILTESLIAFGATGQWSTVLANGDILFRSPDGERSLILARREFNTWGNVPISREVATYLNTDDPGLLPWSSAIVFDNRLLLTAGTTNSEQGVYFKGIVPLNFDPLSTIRGKQPSVWDSGIWTGLNVLQLLTGRVNGVPRAFAFVLNTNPGFEKIELWEIHKSYDPTLPAGAQPGVPIYDNNGFQDLPITWRFDSSALRFGIPEQDHKLLALSNGELWVGDLRGTVTFQTQYRADQYPCWTNWHQWQECQSATSSDSRPGFRPRMGLGQPTGTGCDPTNNRPARNGFTFQVRTIINGHCVLFGEYFEAQEQMQPVYAFAACSPACPPTT
jgi:hypothetical protein